MKQSISVTEGAVSDTVVILDLKLPIESEHVSLYSPMSPAKQNIQFLASAPHSCRWPLLHRQAQDEETRNSEPKTGAISGHVVNENGRPIPNATIYVSGSRSALSSDHSHR